MDKPIVSWTAAKQAGLTPYFTGKPCKRGHVDERWVEGGCDACMRENERNRCAADAGVAPPAVRPP